MEWIKRNIVMVLCFVGVAILGMFLLKECEHSKELEDEVNAVNDFWEGEEAQWISRDSIQAQDIAQMQQNLMTETSARILLEEEFKRFKSINSQVRAEIITMIDTVIEYRDIENNIVDNYQDCIPVDTVKEHFIQIPRIASLEDQWMKIYTTIDTALMIDSLFFINKFDVTIGYKKPDKPLKFLRRKEPVVELISYSPYSKVNYVNNIVVKDKPGTPIDEILIGTGAGILGFFVGRGTK